MTTAEPTRDRSQELTIPKVARKEPAFCGLCGRPCGDSHERYGNRRYCSAEHHREARRINAAENAKRRQVQPSLLAAHHIVLPDPTPRTCRYCKEEKSPEEFYNDRSRVGGKTNICRECEKEKFRAYYRENKGRIGPKSKEAKRVSRQNPPPPLPPGVAQNQSLRWFQRAVQNLRTIVQELPREAALALVEAIDSGRINGALFEDQQGCGCLWGTIGRRLGWSIAEESRRAKQYRQRGCAEVEIFAQIAPGDIPQTNPYAAVAKQTILWTLQGEEVQG